MGNQFKTEDREMKPGQRRIPHTKDSKRGKYPSHEAIILEGRR
jgi:hypothetical protein